MSEAISLSPGDGDTADQELAHAREHFFLPHRYRDRFGQPTTVAYDSYDLLLAETRDPLGSLVTVGERLPDGTRDPSRRGHDYRVLQPRLVMDSNRNRSAVASDALGMVVGTAVMGKPDERLGDSLDGFDVDLTGDRRRLAWVWTYMSIACLFAGDPGEAHAVGERALALAEEVGDLGLRASARTPLGHACCERGDYRRALGRYNGSLGQLWYPTMVQNAWKSSWQYAEAPAPNVVSASHTVEISY